MKCGVLFFIRFIVIHISHKALKIFECSLWLRWEINESRATTRECYFSAWGILPGITLGQSTVKSRVRNCRHLCITQYLLCHMHMTLGIYPPL